MDDVAEEEVEVNATGLKPLGKGEGEAACWSGGGPGGSGGGTLGACGTGWKPPGGELNVISLAGASDLFRDRMVREKL